MGESKFLEELEADLDVELGQSPRYSTIPASPPSYFFTQTQPQLRSQVTTQQPPSLPYQNYYLLPTYLPQAYTRPYSHYTDDEEDFPTQWETQDWQKRTQEKGHQLKIRAKERIGRVVRRLLKIMVALLILVALGIVLGLILLRVKDV